MHVCVCVGWSMGKGPGVDAWCAGSCGMFLPPSLLPLPPLPAYTFNFFPPPYSIGVLHGANEVQMESESAVVTCVGCTIFVFLPQDQEHSICTKCKLGSALKEKIKRLEA